MNAASPAWAGAPTASAHPVDRPTANPRIQTPAATHTPQRVDLHFVPRWPANPYQSELARHLAMLDVHVAADAQLKEIVRALRSPGRQPDVVHLHALPPFRMRPMAIARLILFWWRVWRLQRAGVKIVWTVHNVIDHESSHPAIDRFLARRAYTIANGVIVHSPAALAEAETQWQVTRRRDVHVIPHGNFIDCYPGNATRAEARVRLQLPEKALVFLFIGNIRPYKGVPALVREFKAIATSEMRLVIAGEILSRDLRTEIETAIDGDDRIRFRAEFLPDSEVQVHLAAADVVVFPYTKALTSGALILAMSFGCACIAPRMGAIADTLDPDGGFLYPVTQPNALRSALLAAVEARSSLREMGQHNRSRAAQWGWDFVARQTAAIYRACLSEARPCIHRGTARPLSGQ